MCIAVPGRVVTIHEGQPPSRLGEVVFGHGEPRQVDLAMVPDAGVGDYVIIHSGFAIKKVDEASALESYRLITEHRKA